MHYIEATQLITNPLIEMTLLTVVSFSAISYNLKYHSRVVTSLTYLLAFITAGLGGINYSTILYCTFLVASMAYFSYRLQWHKFLVFAISGTSLVYIWWLYPHIVSAFLVTRTLTVPLYQFYLCSGILLTSWLLFSFGFFSLDVTEQYKLRCVVLGTLINTCAFTFAQLNELYRIKPYLGLQLNLPFWFLVVLSMLYFLYAYGYKKLNKAKLIVVCVSIAFSLIAMAIFVRFPRLSIGFFWLVEMAILFSLGLYYRERAYRVLAAVLSGFILLRLFSVDYFSYKYYALFGLYTKHSVAIFLFTSVTFYLLGMVLKAKRIAEKSVEYEANSYFRYYTILGTFVFAFIPFSRISTSFFLVLEIMLLVLLRLYYRERLYNILAGIVSVFALFRLLFVDYTLSRYYSLFTLDIRHRILVFTLAFACLYLARVLLTNKKYLSILTEDDRYISGIFVIFTTILLVFLVGAEAESKWLSSSWAFAGISILVVGFLLKDKMYRICALCVMTLACLRLIFIDLAGINTIYKIAAFIF